MRTRAALLASGKSGASAGEGGSKGGENGRYGLGGIRTFPFRYTSALLMAGTFPRPVGGPNCGKGPLPASLASTPSMLVSPAPAGARPGSSILLPGACEGGDIVGDPPLVLLAAAGDCGSSVCAPSQTLHGFILILSRRGPYSRVPNQTHDCNDPASHPPATAR